MDGCSRNLNGGNEWNIRANVKPTITAARSGEATKDARTGEYDTGNFFPVAYEIKANENKPYP